VTDHCTATLCYHLLITLLRCYLVSGMMYKFIILLANSATNNLITAPVTSAISMHITIVLSQVRCFVMGMQYRRINMYMLFRVVIHHYNT